MLQLIEADEHTAEYFDVIYKLAARSIEAEQVNDTATVDAIARVTGFMCDECLPEAVMLTKVEMGARQCNARAAARIACEQLMF